MQNDMRARAELIHGCQGLVRSIAWKIHRKLPREVDLEDLIGYGQVGLAEAARDFDMTRGVQFTTYAYYRVRGAVFDGLSTMSWFSKADFARGRYESAANDLLTGQTPEATDGGDPGWFIRTSSSLGAAYVLTHLVGTTMPTGDVIDDRPDSAVEVSELQTEVRQVMDELPEQEQTLIRGIYFEGLSIKEAGERIGISKAWASRLHAKVLESLSHRLTSHRE